MLVRDLNKKECCDLLKRLGFGRLGCASKNQLYVIPTYFAYELDRLLGFSTAGQKIEWMPIPHHAERTVGWCGVDTGVISGSKAPPIGYVP